MRRLELRSERYEAEILDPRRGFERVRLPVEVRYDPLTGRTSRVLPPGSFPPPEPVDLDELSARSRPGCPFCPGRIEEVTPRFPPEVVPEGRIRRGDAVLFPNLVAYAKWSAVSVYSPQRHAIPLPSLDAPAIADNLRAQAAFVAAVAAYAPDAAWASVNANQLPPSGSSIFHPHLQGAANPAPTTAQRVYATVPVDLYRAYAGAEREGERRLGSTGTLDWFASFAPGGQAEVVAFDFTARSLPDLAGEAADEYADGIARVLGLYAELGFASFNMAIYGVPPDRPGVPQVVRLVARSQLGPLQRSDVMWSERLHDETVVDLAPEAVAERGRPRFAS